LHQLQIIQAVWCQFCFYGALLARIGLAITRLMNVRAKFRATMLVVARFQRPLKTNTVIYVKAGVR